MKTAFILAAMAGAVVASPAMAQDGNTSLTGAYAGVLVGIDSVRISDGTDNGSESDLGYGVTVGYDYDTGSAILGVEAEASDSGVSQTDTDLFVVGDSARLSAGRDLYIGARVGMHIGRAAMIYAKGGYTNAKVSLAYDDGATVTKGSDELDGFRVGVGGEWQIGHGPLALRTEYRYSDYGQYSFGGVPTGLSAKRHQGMVGLLAKF